jgi:hypothetical protein
MMATMTERMKGSKHAEIAEHRSRVCLRRRGWVVVDIKRDWKVIFPFEKKGLVLINAQAVFPLEQFYQRSAKKIIQLGL